MGTKLGSPGPGGKGPRGGGTARPTGWGRGGGGGGGESGGGDGQGGHGCGEADREAGGVLNPLDVGDEDSVEVVTERRGRPSIALLA